MIHRIYTERKPEFAFEARNLEKDLKELLALQIRAVRVINTYDAEGISDELLERAVKEVFSDPVIDNVLDSIPESDHVFRVSCLPGQFDQRGHSAEECISFLSPGSSPRVKSSKIYAVEGGSEEDIEKMKKYLINPVEAREDRLYEEGSLELCWTQPGDVRVLEGFLEEEDLGALVSSLGLAMDEEDLAFFQGYFRNEGRDPTITELRVCDTYWSDHCRHTTFLTELEDAVFEDEEAEKEYKEYLELRKETGRDDRPVTLMDLATIGAKALRKRGLLENLDDSEEINACSIKVDCVIDGRPVPYLLLFKNETHNHPTEIEPFGGAATCIGGAIRDPLSGRAFVYQAMRITGSGDVTEAIPDTLPGRLPQRKLALESARGYSSYGNQIGLATGQVEEIYHPGFKAKHMELGAVLGAVPEENVRREAPAPGDVVLLLGGRTGRDGIGGATGSSKSHQSSSLETCGAEVQKGNAPEERKLQRLFMHKSVSRLIKRCNDFGAGGVSVAVGELAPGLEIDLDKVPRKYQGLDGTELAISESQERMAVVVAAADKEAFLKEAEKENLECAQIAVVTENPVLVMKWRGKTIVSLKRSFLDTNGARKKADALVRKPQAVTERPLLELNLASKQGLSERFDSTIGASSVLLPYGGKEQKTPPMAMAALLPAESGRVSTVSLMSYAYDPYLTEADPFRGAYENVVSSVAKLIAAGGTRKGTYLTFQEYFGKTGKDRERWGRPMAALLGALKAQMELECAAIGGKDSMSGTFGNLNVPNTLVSFAVNTTTPERVKSPEFKESMSYIYAFQKEGELKGYLDHMAEVIARPEVLSVSTVSFGELESALDRMSYGNGIGYELYESFVPGPADFILETSLPMEEGRLIGRTREGYERARLDAYEKPLSSVYPITSEDIPGKAETFTYGGRCMIHSHSPRPRVVIPVFPGTNCEIDSKRAFEDAGAAVSIAVVNNLSPDHIRRSISEFSGLLGESEILFIPGGFSGADEPDGSGKFITAFLRNPEARAAVEDLLKREGLVGGICNGFQALVKLGLVPYGRFMDLEEDSPTLSFNTIGRHISHVAWTRVSSAKSPWLSQFSPGELVPVPVSHGEGRFLAPEETIREMAANGQIATQYCSRQGLVTLSGKSDLNGSDFAVEGISSPDGRVFGRMGHIERCQDNVMRNVFEANNSLRFFRGAVGYFK